MNNEMKLLIDLHLDADRLGPGRTMDTEKAFTLTDLSPKKPLRAADIGCGTGASTLELARISHAQIKAFDVFPAFLSTLERKSQQMGFTDRIECIEASMEALPLENTSLDLIWSEGAIYIMGFEKGLKAWRQFLKPGGFLCVSELSWSTSNRPKEIEDYWQNNYPEIANVSEKLRRLELCGFAPKAFFMLPTESWLQAYYEPLQKRFPAFLDRHGHSSEAKALVETEQKEIRLYQKYGQYFSYGFYIAQKTD